MAEYVAWLNGPEKLHPVLLVGVAQFQFIHIHPFVEGNGRTARLLSTLCLCTWNGALKKGGSSPSPEMFSFDAGFGLKGGARNRSCPSPPLGGRSSYFSVVPYPL
jgi:hypothetical protein